MSQADRIGSTHPVPHREPDVPLRANETGKNYGAGYGALPDDHDCHCLTYTAYQSCDNAEYQESHRLSSPRREAQNRPSIQRCSRRW